MYDTALSDYKVSKTPFGRDPIAEIAEHAVARRTLGSTCRCSTGNPAYRRSCASAAACRVDYLEFLYGQVRELSALRDMRILAGRVTGPRVADRACAELVAPGGDFGSLTLRAHHSCKPDAVYEHTTRTASRRRHPGYEATAGENTNPV